MTLFEHKRKQDSISKAPLAARMRPRRLDEFVGQEHLIGSDKVLRKSIDADQIPVSYTHLTLPTSDLV